MKKNLKKFLLFIILCAVLISVDQTTKYLANILLMKNYIIIKDFFYFELIYNHGAAFGMLKNARIFFCILTIIVLLLVEYVYVKIPADKKYNILKISFILLFSGAAGNLIDRLKYGYVTDFIAFDFGNYSFPRFNCADIYVTISFIALFILFIFIYKDEDISKILGRKKKDGE